MSDSRENSLIEISLESLPILKDKFKVEWPSHVIAYNLLDNYIKRFGKCPESQKVQKVYGLNGEWENDGTFIAVMYEHQAYERHVIFASLDPTLKNLKLALKLLEYTDKNLMTLFMCTRSVYRSTLHEIIKEGGLHVLFDDGTKMKYLRKEDAKKFDVELPQNFQLRALTKDNAEKINSVRPMRSNESVAFIEYMIEYNINIGLYDETNELVAWCLQLDFGSLATLQVDEKHYRKGYGALVTKAICKKIAVEDDQDITSNVVFSNFKSLNLFQKLAFEEIDENFWIGVKKLE